jgi:predicted TIM-barrel fold metal-dependent hydrolase
MLITRRELLFGAVATVLAKASQPQTKLHFEIPSGACDCHVHVFGDPARFPFAPARGYTPEVASIEELRSLHRALSIDRVVVVQPSVYATDNACTLDAVWRLGNRARGIAVIDDKTPDAALDEMARAGVRGIRINFAQAGVTDPDAARRQFQTAVERVKRRNWHIQINTQPRVIEGIADVLSASPVPLVFDHFGGATAPAGVQQPGFAALVNLVKSGKAYVKISAAGDNMSTAKPAYADVTPFAKALVAANPQRILWGTNWPHPDAAPRAGRKTTDIAPLLQTDDAQILNLLPVWVPDAATRRMILVDNPARLYRF